MHEVLYKKNFKKMPSQMREYEENILEKKIVEKNLISIPYKYNAIIRQYKTNWDTIHSQKAIKSTTCKYKNSLAIEMLRLMKMLLGFGKKKKLGSSCASLTSTITTFFTRVYSKRVEALVDIHIEIYV
ncbi:hypothetical protein CR513_50327, partial [Mucuna pruriens]